MNAAPHSAPIPLSMLQSIAEAICDRPHDTAAQRVIRSRAVVATVQGFQPRNPMEVMLTGLAVTHAHLIVDAANDVFCGQDSRVKARTRSAIVALGRGMFGFLKELRTFQTKGLEAAAAGSDAVDATDAVAIVPVEPLDEAPPPAAGPGSRIVAAGPLAHRKTPEPPVPLLPPVRRAETSVAAMMAVMSSPVPSYVISRAADPSAATPPAAGHTAPSVREVSGGVAEALAA
jgi:hypothetical protein